MEITWHDNTCFVVREKNISLIIDPHKSSGKLAGNIVLSGRGDAEPVAGAEKLFNWPGEYEIKDIPIRAIPVGTKEGASDTLIFCFAINEVKFCHLGELGHVPSSEIIKEIGDVDVLMIKIGKNSNLSAKQVTEIIEGIEPRAVIPMGENIAAGALKDIGAEKVETRDKFTLKSASDLPDEEMQYVVLSKAQ